MAINKVVYGNQVLIDITDSTVNPNTLLAGYKAYGANGQPVNGALQLSYHITLKQAQYDALSESEKMADENWFYIDDAESIGAQLDDSAISPAKVWSSQKTNSEIQDVQDQVDINTTDIGTLNSALTPVLFTLNSVSGVTIDSNQTKCYKIGHIVVMTALFTVSTAVTPKTFTFASVPSEYKPSNVVACFAADNTNDIPISGMVSDTGDIKMYRNGTQSATSFRLSATYVI